MTPIEKTISEDTELARMLQKSRDNGDDWFADFVQNCIDTLLELAQKPAPAINPNSYYFGWVDAMAHIAKTAENTFPPQDKMAAMQTEFAVDLERELVGLDAHAGRVTADALALQAQIAQKDDVIAILRRIIGMQREEVLALEAENASLRKQIEQEAVDAIYYANL